MKRTIVTFAALLIFSSAFAGALPTKVGRCTTTSIKEIGTRLDGVPDSGGSVTYANGGYQVSYDPIPGLKGARKGDRVKLCLTSLPKDCPKGDDRGKTYKATDLRTHKSWEEADWNTCAAGREGGVAATALDEYSSEIETKFASLRRARY